MPNKLTCDFRFLREIEEIKATLTDMLVQYIQRYTCQGEVDKGSLYNCR